MTREMHNVSMLSDEEITIEGETYELERGDIVALSFTTARNYVNQFGIAEFVGKKYPVLDEEYEEKVGPTGDTADGLKDENPSAKSGEDDGESEDEDESGDVDVTDLTVSEVEDEVAEVEDVEVLNGMLKFEEEGDDRKGAKEAIKARIEELEESESDDAEEDQDEE